MSNPFKAVVLFSFILQSTEKKTIIDVELELFPKTLSRGSRVDFLFLTAHAERVTRVGLSGLLAH